jgi:hypothetical protein
LLSVFADYIVCRGLILVRQEFKKIRKGKLEGQKLKFAVLKVAIYLRWFKKFAL